MDFSLPLHSFQFKIVSFRPPIRKCYDLYRSVWLSTEGSLPAGGGRTGRRQLGRVRNSNRLVVATAGQQTPFFCCLPDRALSLTFSFEMSNAYARSPCINLFTGFEPLSPPLCRPFVRRPGIKNVRARFEQCPRSISQYSARNELIRGQIVSKGNDRAV